ncbi:MAG TPA: polysaccharide biosynthesis tyrosine autokinase [Thermoanaerobaculia bacterium]|nr:polysaccharide biosynthesis tyrosine autokinase [Thermoanaerobaculia bacterium]
MAGIQQGGGVSSPIFRDEERTIGLPEAWAIVVKGRKLILFSLFAGLLTAILISLFAEPKYRTTVVLNVERDTGRFFEVGSDAQSYTFYDPQFFTTQTRLMRSREVAERVITRLNLLGHPELAPPRSGFFRFFGGSAGTTTGDLAKAANRIQENATATAIPGTNLVELGYVGRNAKITADIANALAESYIDWSLESKYQVVGQASKFLGTQIEQLKTEVDEKEQELHNYGLQKDIISVDPKTNVTLQKLESLNRDYATAVSDRVTKEAHYYEVQATPNDALAQDTTDATVVGLKGELSKLQRTYNEKLQVYKPEWPAMQQLRFQIEETQKTVTKAVHDSAARIRDDARREYLTAQRRESALQAELSTQKQEAMQLNSNAVEFNNLRNEVDTKRNLLDTLQKRQAETEVTARLRGQRVSNIRVVDRALVPGSAFSPSYPRNIWAGLLYGLIVGLGLALFRDFLDRSLRTVEDVEHHLMLPALGVIPAVGTVLSPHRWYGYGGRSKKKPSQADPEEAKIELLPHMHQRSAVAEAYRAVRAALLLSQAGGVRSIVITSCLPEEGKTSTALNLAIVLGQLDKRVLLIDADLHKPRLHDALRLTNRVGLVSILVENVSPTRVIQPTQIPGVAVVTSGPPSPNPSGLLSSESMRTLLQFAEMNFDYVLLDSPPLDSVADAMLIGAQTDGVVLCVEGGSTPRERVRRICNRLRAGNVNILGVLINKFHEQTFGYGKAYRYYRAGYGYGYGEEKKVAAD